MKVSINMLAFCSFLIFLLNIPIYSSEDPSANKQALDMIYEFSKKICESDVQHSGKLQKTELSGDAKVELNGFLKKMAQLGIKAGASYEGKEYVGVLQEDLAKILNKQLDCRESIANKLIDLLIINKPVKTIKKTSTIVKEDTTKSKKDSNIFQSTSKKPIENQFLMIVFPERYRSFAERIKSKISDIIEVKFQIDNHSSNQSLSPTSYKLYYKYSPLESDAQQIQLRLGTEFNISIILDNSYQSALELWIY